MEGLIAIALVLFGLYLWILHDERIMELEEKDKENTDDD